jgi:hypothetical protein
MEQIDAFRRGTMAADELSSAAAHMQRCVECAEKTRFAPQVLDGAVSLRMDLANAEHPDLEELFAYADAAFDSERQSEIVAHIDKCDRCHETVADAMDERAQTRGRPLHWLGVAAAVAVITCAGVWWLNRAPSGPIPSSGQRVHIEQQRPVPRGEWDQLVAAARKTGRIQRPPIISELRSPPAVLRSQTEATADAAMQPAGVTVVSDHPRLTWSARAGERYVATVVCNHVVVARSGEVEGGAWISTQPLPRGANCVWQVEGVTNQVVLPVPPALQPMFHVLDEPALAEIKRAESQQPPDDFVVALLYARAGAQPDAVQRLQVWLEAHPNDQAAIEILHSIQSW